MRNIIIIKKKKILFILPYQLTNVINIKIEGTYLRNLSNKNSSDLYFKYKYS
jgi:hypothetical protein